MYECRFLNLKEMQTSLGLGRNRTLRLCQEHTHNFPAVMVGNRYQADYEKLLKWKDDWYEGKVSIN